MAIQMTRAEYEAKYGVKPVIPATQNTPAQDTTIQTKTPVRMTRSEYEAKYGVAPIINQKKPTPPVQTEREKRIAAGLPVGAGERAEPTLGGSILRDIAAIPVKTAMSVARPFYDPLGKKGGAVVKSKYFGDLTDYGTQIEKKTEELAGKYKKGEISLGRAALGGAGAGAKAGLDVAQFVPVDAIVAGAGKVIAGTVPKVLENVATRTVGEATIPTLKTATKEALKRSGAFAGAYDVASQLESGEKYNPLQTAAAVAMGTGVDVGASKVLPEVFNSVKNVTGRLNPKNAQERLINKAEQDIFDIQNNYAKTRKKIDYSKDSLASNRRRVAASGVLTDSVDDTGTVRTTQKGGASEKYYDMVIKGNESIVRDSLEKEGKTINPVVLKRELIRDVESNPLIKGKAKTQALRDIEAEIAGYGRDSAGNIPLVELHDAKIATTKIIRDFATPAEYKSYQKSLASGLKKTIEKYSSADIEKINEELSRYYQDIELIDSLDGKKVKGGKLGKYFSQIAGNVAGGAIGSIGGPIGSAAGAIAGGEVGSAIRSATMKKTFGNLPLNVPERSAILEAAKADISKPRLQLPAPNAVEPNPTGVFVPQGKPIELPANLPQANAEQEAIRGMQANLPAKGIPLEYTAYPERYTPEANLPTIEAGPTPRPPQANLPTAKEPPSVYSPEPSPKSVFTNEPYVPEQKLPTIQMGAKPKAPKANIPTIQMDKAPLPKVAVLEKPTLSLKKKANIKPTIEFNTKTGVVTDPKKAVAAAKEFVKKNGAQNGMYAFGGITVDDNGDISYDPKQAAAFMAAGMIGQSKASQEMFRGFADLSLKTLERMVGRSRVSKQFITDMLKQQDVVKPEREMMESILKDFGPEISVKEFADRVKTELLPLKVKYAKNPPVSRYENVTLPDNIRGKVSSYNERIYESPIKTQAGEVHWRRGEVENYFAHTRIEDMADKETRRVIELQSDLMQKGNLEKEFIGETVEIKGNTYLVESIEPNNKILVKNPMTNKTRIVSKELVDLYDRGIGKLKPYENDWYKRIIPEEIKSAAVDKKKKLQFPTGETAMKIEGLGDTQSFELLPKPDRQGNYGPGRTLTQRNIRVGAEILDMNEELWIITNDLGNGKFKAIPSDITKNNLSINWQTYTPEEITKEFGNNSRVETFDISGKIDTSNPIYRFYDGDVRKYLKRYGGTEVTDKNGVTWIEVNVDPKWKDVPVPAFGFISPEDRPLANIPKKIVQKQATIPN